MHPVYAPSEQHLCYTLRRGCSYSVAVCTTPGDVYAFLWPIATFYLSAIAIYWMPHSPHICLTLRFCHILQYSLRFGYLACHCICFAIIIFYRSEIYIPIFTLSSTMPSVLHILRWSIIGLRCFFLLIRIRIVAILALIPVNITGSQVSPLHSALIHHPLVMLLPPHPHPHPHRRHPRPHTRRHHWVPGQSSTFCVDPSSTCDASSSSSASASASSPSLPSYSLTSLGPRSVLYILCWSIIDLRYFFLLICIRIRIVAILAIIPIDRTCSQVKPLKFRRRPSSPADGGDGIAIVAFITFVFVIPAATWHPKMKFVIRAIDVYQDVWVSASDLRLLKRHFGGQIIKKNSIVNMPCFHADHHGRCWVLRLLDLTLDCSKSVVIHPLLIALW